MYLDVQKEKWDHLHSDSRLRLVYPSEQVVRFTKSSFRENKESTHVLDLGCGSGRHIFYLLQEGFQVTGMDLSQECVDFVRDAVQQQGGGAALHQGSATALPYEDESFDGIVCHGVLLYLKADDIKQAIHEIHRTLKPGGKALVVVRSLQDMRVGRGECIEPNTYLLTDNFTNEEGMVMHFFSEDEIYDWFAQFSSVQVGISEASLGSLEQFNSDYLIILTK